MIGARTVMPTAPSPLRVTSDRSQHRGGAAGASIFSLAEPENVRAHLHGHVRSP